MQSFNNMYLGECDTPEFIYPIDNITVAAGRDAHFTCVVNKLQGHKVNKLQGHKVNKLQGHKVNKLQGHKVHKVQGHKVNKLEIGNWK